ncbi:MAG: hypothetical protein U9N87_06315 [Planctomycetota bacterium]|nr:hypothetical protein [Planctomycetota bacterium]
MSEPLVSPRFIFRFSLPCRRKARLWTAKGAGLDESYRLVGLAELEHPGRVPDFRAAWSEAGMAFSVLVEGKQQPPCCRATRVGESDGVQIWIDTRNVQNVHRAGRFCHRLAFLPSGDDAKASDPVAAVLPINRARELHGPIHDGQLEVAAQILADGYRLDAFVPAEALTGFNPEDHPAIGFNYAVLDRELGDHTLSAGGSMPYREDPSLWATLELTR